MAVYRDPPPRSRWPTVLVFILIFVCTVAVSAYITNTTKDALTDSTRSELSALAALAASQVNGTMLAGIEPGDENTPEFIAIRDQLFAMEQSDPSIKSIYTMRLVNDTAQFVVDAEYGLGTPGEDPHIGDIYPEVTTELIGGFNQTTAEDEFVTDQWGTTLSGYSPVLDSQGNPVGLVGVDMTADQVIARIDFFDRMFLFSLFAIIFVLILIGTGIEIVQSRADRALAVSSRRYQAVIDTQTEFIIRFLADGNLTFSNAAYCRYRAKPCSELIGTLQAADIHPDDRKKVADTLATLGPASPEASIEYRTIASGGEIRWLQWTIQAFFDDHNQVYEYQAVGSDVTEKRRTEEALARATKKLSHLNHIVFTDIRNSLFVLSSYFSLENDLYPAGQKERFHHKQEEMIGRIEISLEAVKDYQNMGLYPPVWQNVKYTFLLAISHQDLSSLSRRIEIRNVEIFADPLFERVFSHLTQNVLDHAGTATEISVADYETDTGYVLVFSDNGAGIPPGLKEAIFDQSFLRKSFDLFLCREILSITGITIRETGEYGKGARFELHVPKGSYRFIQDPQPGNSSQV